MRATYSYCVSQYVVVSLKIISHDVAVSSVLILKALPSIHGKKTVLKQAVNIYNNKLIKYTLLNNSSNLEDVVSGC